MGTFQNTESGNDNRIYEIKKKNQSCVKTIRSGGDIADF